MTPQLASLLALIGLVVAILTACLAGETLIRRIENRGPSRLRRLLDSHQHAEQRLRDELHAEAEQVFPSWDADRRPPGCGCIIRWNGNADRGELHPCDSHALAERVGRHRAAWDTPLDDQPAEIIAAVVTDVQKKKP